ERDTSIVISGYELRQNHPNPFIRQTTISYAIPDPGFVRIVIYNSAGQVVRAFSKKTAHIGEFSVVWDGRDNAGKAVASGVYFYSLETPETRIFRQLVKMN
ncbi:MAG: T9SS type A sorting domain-containing protein, partial [candidate division WOR-3 bacterium]